MNRGYGSHAVAGGQSHVRTVAGTVGEFSGNGPAAGRVSSTPMKGLSYLGLDHTGFGWEVKVRLEILICYLDGDIGFFLRRMCQSDPRVEGEGDAVRLVEASFTANNKKRVVLTEVASLGALCI